jgi:hypothetical protein
MTGERDRAGGPLTRWLERAPAPVFVVYASAAAFGAYFCMYAFRKPFAAARFEGAHFLDGSLELKSALVISQVVGYALSKYIGIKVVSELAPRHHAVALVGLIVWAEAALFVFAGLPGDAKVIGIFLNGLSLGMVWGLVVRYLEGRVTSELLLAGLSASFIVSSGMVKDFGRALMSGAVAEGWTRVPWIGGSLGRAIGVVDESWMPAVAGLHFLPPFVLFVWLLAQIPGPTPEDARERHRRVSMDAPRRLAFWRAHWAGLLLLLVAYLLLTAYRDFRDNFAVEIFDGLGYPYAGHVTIISRAETWIAVGVVASLAVLNVFRRSRQGLVATYAVMAGGTLMLGLATWASERGWIDGFAWMTLVGLGSYLAYVPYGSLLFERLMAHSGILGTAVFAIYLADAIGYTGSVGVMVLKDFAASEVSRVAFFRAFTWWMAGVGTICLVWSCGIFLRPAARTDGA